MSFASQSTKQKFPFSYDAVFNGLIKAIPSVGMKIKSQDRRIGRITASTGMSLFSYGENLTVVVEKIDDQATMVGIESALKYGTNITGAPRHQRNFDKIISALSQLLQRKI